MFRSLALAAACAAGVSVPLAVTAAPLTETLSVTALEGPWSQALNPSLAYGINGNTGAAATTSAAFDFAQGASFTIAYISGLATPLSYSQAIYDGRGDLDYVTTGATGTSGTAFPSQYLSASDGTTHLGMLVGAFALDGVVVGTPFAVNNGVTVSSPGGVDQILFGYNDDIFDDNKGALTVQITGSTVSPVPLPASAPLFGLALLGLGGLGLRRRFSRAAR